MSAIRSWDADPHADRAFQSWCAARAAWLARPTDEKANAVVGTLIELCRALELPRETQLSIVADAVGQVRGGPRRI